MAYSLSHRFDRIHTGLIAALSLLLIPLSVIGETNGPDKLMAVIDGDHRSAEHRARDRYRHPYETLTWFGLRPDMVVVEIYPGAGWYTEILAPFLREEGLLYTAGYDADSDTRFLREGARRFREKLAASPQLYDKVQITELAPPEKIDIAPPGSADLVLTFRNVHNWMAAGTADAVFAAMYRALAPDGVLGLVEHRQDASRPQDPRAGSGYVREDHVIALAEAAGFILIGSSEINANAMDGKEYEKGVWTLPPTLRLGDKDRETYLSIGESDRMTLKFRKPATP